LGQAIVLGPPFIMTEDEMDQMFAILKETMREVFDEIGL
jgi:adenosylmethionine-8-amino-7-oxononanoate aminotransferase